MAGLNIGKLAARSGVNIETIRYYERIGIIPAPPRTAGGQRRYQDEDLRRLSFVRRCRELGFPLDEIRAILRLVDGGEYSCAEVHDFALRQLEAIRRRITDLRTMAHALDALAADCKSATVPRCPIIDALYAIQR